MEIRKQIAGMEVRACMEKIGEDYCVQVGGGERPHIGCVVLATPRPSLLGDGTLSATSSVLNVVGHKDEEVCRYIAEEIAKKKNAITVCTGGIHMDHIAAEQIQELLNAVRELAEELEELC